MNPRSILFGSCILFFLLPPFNFFDFSKNTQEADLSLSKKKTEIFQPTLMEICDNGIDDDGDGLVDCFDDDCFGTTVCEDFYYGPGSVNPCTFVPEVGDFDLELIYQTDRIAHPIDQRVGAYVGDMDGDGIPEIVTHNTTPGKVYIFSGVDGTIKQEIDAPASSVFMEVAIADVDLNGKGDVFYVDNARSLIRYEYGSTAPVWQTASAMTQSSFTGIHVADFDGDGNPEVYIGNRIFNSADGTRLAIGSGNFGNYASSDAYTLAYDIFKPGDPKPGGGVFGAEVAGLELLAGNQVYSVELGNGMMDNGTLTVVSQLNVSALEGDGFVSIGDIDDDGKVDILIMDGGRVYVWNPRTATQIGDTYQISGTNGGGRINVGDFDNDGKAEFGTAGRNIYVVLEYDPATNTLVEVWTKTGVDDGSQRTGSSLFDFEGDGKNEVVYSEEANLFILDGATGAELLRVPSEAGTRTEYPLVADVNGDGAAEIIVTAQVGNGPGFSGGDDYVSVYRSKGFPWVSARPVWNQHGYFNTNINDDLSVPKVQQDIMNPAFGNSFNSFLTQTTILAGGDPAFAAPDATIEILGSTLDECPKVETEMKIKNLGSAILPAVTPIAFYDNDPTSVAATLLDVSTIGINIAAGDSANITYNVCLPSPIVTPLVIYVVVNDTGFLAVNLPYDFEDDFPVTSVPECDFTNNITRFTSLTCVEICGDGKDNDGDELADEPNITAPDTTGCSGDILSQMTTDLPGGTWKIISSIGSTISPTGVVTLGTNHSSTPDFDTVIYELKPCPDTVLVSIVDSENPLVSCPTNQTEILNNNCQVSLDNYVGSASATDNCSEIGDIKITQSPTSGTTIGLGITVVTITAEDEAGNKSTCTFNVTSIDNTDPAITCPANQDITLDGNCEYNIADFTGATVSDNCSLAANIDVTQAPAIGTTLSNHNTSQVITLTAEDEAGNTRQCTFTITLKDETDPTITCPANQDITLDGNCEYNIADFTGATVSDNCSLAANIDVTQSPVAGTTLSNHNTSQVITLTAEDEANNTRQCTFTITLKDETDPTITCPANQDITLDGNCEYNIADFTGATVSDNCSTAANIDVTQSPVAGTTLSNHNTSQVITLTAEDEANNTMQCTFTITLKDETDPTITCPANQDITLDGNCEYNIADFTGTTVSDNCSTTANIDVTQSPVAGTTLSDHNTSQVITLTAKDEANNTRQCAFTITLKDETDPAITCPANQDITLDGNCEYDIADFTGATISDNCSLAANIDVTQSPAIGTTLSDHNTSQVITLTAEDEANNTRQCTFTITLKDETDPAITCPANQDITLDGNCEYDIADFTSATVSDNCSTAANIDVTQSPAIGTTLSDHNTSQVITLTAEDEASNTRQCTFTITLKDETDPTITCPANQDITLDGNCEYDIADFTSATVSDNCSTAANIDVTQSPVAGTTLSNHNTSQVITLTAEDEASNTRQCTFTITLKDETDPTITCPANQNLAVGNNCFAVVPDYIDDATIMDNCSATANITTTQSPTIGTILATIGSTQIITLTVEDEIGNTQQCTFTITLTDETDPAIFCPANTTINVDGSCEYDIADFTGAVATDNCSAAADIDISQSPVSGTTISGHGTIQTVTLTAEDEAGNSADCSFDITLNDNSDPSITCPTNQTLIANTDCEVTIGDYTSATVSDNCTAAGSIIVTQSPVSGTTIAGTTTITLTANDGNGNTKNCTFNILIDDDTDPTITCPTNADVTVNGDCEYVVPDLTGGATVDDNCTAAASISISQNPTVGSILSGHNTTQTITLTANDGNGNTAQCTFDITLKDESDPSILCPSTQDVFVDGDCEFDIPDYASASVDDNCTAAGSITVTQAPIAGTTLSDHNTTQTITLTANDGNGNTSQCTFDITLKDNTQPSITCPTNQTLVPNANCEITLPDYTSATVDDNCTTIASISVTQSPAAGAMLAPSGGTATVTLTADDGNGNSINCSFSIEFGDISPPSITCPADTIRDINADCQYTIEDFTDKAVVADNCAAITDIDVTQSPIAGIVLTGASTVQSITLTADDGNGNTANCSFNVALRDTTSPAITCPLNADLMVDNNCEVVINDYASSATSTDNCSSPSNIIVTQNPLAGTTLSGNGTMQTIILTATDESGNTKDCDFEITILDETDPSITCPVNQTVDLDANCEYILGDFTGLAILADNCTPAGVITVTQSPTPLTVFENEPSVETITITADDNNGGVVTCTFELTIQDVTDPIITCPDELDKNLNGDCEYTLEDLSNLVVGANECADDYDLTITQIPAAGTVFDNVPISQVITLTAEDNSGNSTLCQIEINLIDEIAPTVICPDNKIETGAGCDLEIVDYLSEVTITDNCSILGDMTITQSPTAGTVLATGVHTITITVEDESGNESSCAFVLELQLDPPTMPEIGGN